MKLTIPTLLTIFRVLLIPIFLGVFFFPEYLISDYQKNLIATLVFIIAALTDWFDGYLARLWKETSAFGAFLDPVADKLIVSGALIILVQLDRTNAIIAFIIIGREITISALREWMAQVGAAKSMAVNSLGKLKTISQLIAIPMLLYSYPFFGVIDTLLLGSFLLYLSTGLTLLSMFYYLRKAWFFLNDKNKIN